MMAAVVRTEHHDRILVVVVDSPPLNLLGAAVRAGLVAAVREGIADPQVDAMVLRCAGKTFFAGADINEFGKPPVGPDLGAVIDAVATSAKPVIAAIHGSALGGGCEVALGCHYRIAVSSASLGTPEVKLGLLPGAGGTQRIPRLAGIGFALRMIALGNPISTEQAADAGLIDKIVGSEDLVTDAISFARAVAGRRPLPRASDKPAIFDAAAIAAFRQANGRRLRGFDAPEAVIRCIEKAADGSSFADGLAFERAEFVRLMGGTQSAAQRHLFFAERKAGKIDGIAADLRRRVIDRVGVVGAGTMGAGIAMNFLSAGLPVILVETERKALDRGVGLMRRNYEASAAKGRMTVAQVEHAMALLTPTLRLDDLGECTLIVEAAYEDMALKKEIFVKLDGIAMPGAILASNTSYLDIDEIAAATGRPGDVLGMHFFSPANVMKLLEVVRGAHTSADVLATIMALAKTINKVAVVAGVTPGFIGNRMLRQRQTEAYKLLLEGASPEQIDRVHVAFGMPMGPFQMADLAGVDIGWHRDPTRIENIREALCAEGRWGQKTGAGYYDYDESRTAATSPRVAEIIREWRARTPMEQRNITDEEIVERTLYPVVNEGALILEEGKAQRSSDIDAVWATGYGWPVYRGGPMFWAAIEGLSKIVAGLEKHGFQVALSLRERAQAMAPT